MSAPERTPLPTDTGSIPLDLARSIESREKWVIRFSHNLKRDFTAEKAWEILKRAGLEVVAHKLLYFYAHPPFSVAKQHDLTQSVKNKIEALILADKVAKDRQRVGDPRERLFLDRSMQKEICLLESEMPFLSVRRRLEEPCS